MCKQNQNNAGLHMDKSFALVMIVLCAIALIVPFIIQSINHTTNAISIHVCKMDSIPSGDVLSAADAALVFKELEKKEIELSSKYDYTLQQRENEYWWQNYLSYVIGIIVAICGFFGYKSIQDMKDRVHQDANQIVAEEVKRYLDKELDEIVNKKVSDRIRVLYEPSIMDVEIKKLRDELMVRYDRLEAESSNDKKSNEGISSNEHENDVLQNVQAIENDTDLKAMFNA